MFTVFVTASLAAPVLLASIIGAWWAPLGAPEMTILSGLCVLAAFLEWRRVYPRRS